MLRSSQLLLVASALLVWSCETDDDSPTGETSEAGEGGQSNSGASVGSESAGSPGAGQIAGAEAGGATGANMGGLGGIAGSEHAGGAPCDLVPECCAVPDHQPCRGLVQADCSTREYCSAVIGTRYNPADMMGEGGVHEPTYLGCHSVCTGINTIESCIYRQDSPNECWRVSGATPDDGNWVKFGCYSDPPPEECEFP